MNLAIQVNDAPDSQDSSFLREEEISALAAEVRGVDPVEAAEKLTCHPAVVISRVLLLLGPVQAIEIIDVLSAQMRKEVITQLPPRAWEQWQLNQTFPAGSVGRLMDAPHALLPIGISVGEAIEVLREEVRREFVTYGYVVNSDKRLVGVMVMRELLFADPRTPIEEVMVPRPFFLNPDTPLLEAMSQVVSKHYPVYPVCNSEGLLIGLVRGFRLFEAQAIEISAQAGSMVGVEKEEHLGTSLGKSFRYRHPWLQLNLLTAFLAGAVVSIFQDTIDRMVVLAAFLPVLAGQSGNTGCQALAVTLRGMTLGQFKSVTAGRTLVKEMTLGLLNGFFVGVSAGVGMYLLAWSQGNPSALALSLIVVAAMMGSCIISGLAGAVIPLALKRVGADPATASSIFLTTATDVASMGMLLGLARWLVL